VAARTALLKIAVSFGRVETEGIAVERFSRSVIHLPKRARKTLVSNRI
jgi:hypothetical protein